MRVRVRNRWIPWAALGVLLGILHEGPGVRLMPSSANSSVWVRSSPPIFGVPHARAVAHGFSQHPARLGWLARLIQAEAGTQSRLAQESVGAVALNRLRAPGFPHTWSAMLSQRDQFQSVANGSWVRAVPSAAAWRAARAAWAGRDPTHGALYFYAPALPHAPWMDTLTGCRVFGALRFCRSPSDTSPRLPAGR